MELVLVRVKTSSIDELPVILAIPVTLSLSLTSITPLEESSVRFPAFVSIVLVVASAILILPNVRLPPLTAVSYTHLTLPTNREV